MLEFRAMDEQTAARADVRKRRKLADEADERFRAATEKAYGHGASLGQLAEDSGLSIETVRKLLRNRGVKMRRQGRRNTNPMNNGMTADRRSGA